MQIKTESIAAFFRQYDRVLALAALLILLVSLGYLVSAGVQQHHQQEQYIKRLAQPHEPKAAKPTDLTPYQKAGETLQTPKHISVPAPTAATFLTPERRFICTNPGCPGVMVPWTKEDPPAKCPFCGTEFVKAPTGPVDTDMDGMPDDWEKKYSLDPNNPADAHDDADKDGFTNLEEFLAGTDPADPKSHPDIMTRMILIGIEGRKLPIVFSDTSTMPDGKKMLAFNLPQARPPKTVYVREGEMIDVTGFKALKFTEKKQKIVDPKLQNAEKEIDVSTVDLIREADGKKVTLRRGSPNTMLEEEAKIELPMDKFTATLSPESEFEVRDEKYVVKSIDKAASTVIILRERDKKEYVVGRTPSADTNRLN